jgi:ribonucleoside-triphosphate reductase (formate)
MAKYTMTMVIKRNGIKEEFKETKIIQAIEKAFVATEHKPIPDNLLKSIKELFPILSTLLNVEDIQNAIEKFLMEQGYYDVAKGFILYREQHRQARFIKERIAYMDKYTQSLDNAATASETDANANVVSKNVANLEGEVYKTTNRNIQRQRMKEKLNSLYPGENLSSLYIRDLEDNIIYQHDEASTPTLKKYCEAVSLYPLMLDGVGNMDKVTPTPPNDIQSFSGQVTNLTFLLSSQCKGAVAEVGYFVALNYYVIKEFGSNWYDKLDIVFTNEHTLHSYTIKNYILKGMKQYIYGINQAAGNRSYNSPFTNVSWFDKYYFEAMYGEFYYPDGSQPEWKAVDTLQRMFMKLMRDIRLIKPITFPVTTMSLLYDENTKEFKDAEYAELCAEEWAKGGSFFCYMNSNPSSLASCCRVLSDMDNNIFSSTTGMNGEMTGSCNVLSLNINRITQDYFRGIDFSNADIVENSKEGFKKYLIDILERVYKYQIAYKTLLYEEEEKQMFADCNANYIRIKKLYSTIGVIGYMEAAEFLGLKISNNDTYKHFLSFIFSIITEQNKKHSINDKKRTFKFNLEAIPGESLGVKWYQKDMKDGYRVTPNRERYSCYFFNPWDKNISVLDKLKLHGGEIAKALSGGQAAHINLDSHLSKAQYLQLMKVAATVGCNYFTFNIPMSECKECKHIVNAPIKKCPICNSEDIKYYTRTIGYLTTVDNWALPMQKEFTKRIFTDKTIEEINA